MLFQRYIGWIAGALFIYFLYWLIKKAFTESMLKGDLEPLPDAISKSSSQS